MRIVSINVSRPQTITIHGKRTLTGIFKKPVQGTVRIGKLRVEGDSQADLSVHGGPDKAVYIYPYEHYPYWERELGTDSYRPGHFGENLTTEGATEKEVCIGDIFSLGTARIQVTQPRQPCSKLATVMRDPRFSKRFLESGRVGFYARVLEEGDVCAGDSLTLLEREPTGVSVLRMSRLIHFDHDHFEDMRRVLQISSLPSKLRSEFQNRLVAAGFVIF